MDAKEESMIRTLMLSTAVLVSSVVMSGQASAFGHRHHRDGCGSRAVCQAPVRSYYGTSAYTNYRSPRVSVGYGGYGGYRNYSGYRGYGGYGDFGRSYYGNPGYRSGGISIGIGRGVGIGGLGNRGYGLGW